MFSKKIILITGATGSFGNAIIKKLLETDIKEIRVFSRDEKKQEDMRLKFNSHKLKFYLGDVRNYESIYNALKDVDYVFHAAALKQVPSCEFFPLEAVRTNILGAENVLNAAINNKVKRVVVLSTDKAVYPINAMGLSKAMMEKLMVAKSRTIAEEGTILCCTRYGNVMASRGSVIPLFVQQIKEGKSLSITDPSMTRFLMSLKDSVNLVLYAFQHAKQGDILIQKAPAATIEDLANALIEIFNYKNNIQLIGIRHGEKLYESLVSSEEMVKAEDLGEYYRIPADNRDLNYSKYFVEGNLKTARMQDYTSHNTKRLNVQEVKELLLSLDFIKEQM
ncbi:UDP-glucose 4-epimerase [Pseudolycoriella hygida]|uniref:UDP-glucose 4-epimerase n=1 Tax=Pseudolycoriella hygida TaxID=35572 RepID=A0A9Q0N7A4_9DIPT|nr:UDP-glucose 4-epimerase [Pseudolycoriella hygida]